ncbi:hypothetical protein BO99DRAFT_197787 [Aspergillus violaceofuscus CBS 115571]|uniref:Uncharacterized protein n=1 Tax=Aspergillus violaceofuscus (strain CBS 115571) TaxID=1450538 RepID=A0A2V5HLY5_ASPV1|nr:hypothetical protein BO99DRAFT_197787 [Aspergillus violaceofuscus CBS 115571]
MKHFILYPWTSWLRTAMLLPRRCTCFSSAASPPASDPSHLIPCLSVFSYFVRLHACDLSVRFHGLFITWLGIRPTFTQRDEKSHAWTNEQIDYFCLRSRSQDLAAQDVQTTQHATGTMRDQSTILEVNTFSSRSESPSPVQTNPSRIPYSQRQREHIPRVKAGCNTAPPFRKAQRQNPMHLVISKVLYPLIMSVS